MIWAELKLYLLGSKNNASRSKNGSRLSYCSPIQCTKIKPPPNHQHIAKTAQSRCLCQGHRAQHVNVPRGNQIAKDTWHLLNITKNQVIIFFSIFNCELTTLERNTFLIYTAASLLMILEILLMVFTLQLTFDCVAENETNTLVF